MAGVPASHPAAGYPIARITDRESNFMRLKSLDNFQPSVSLPLTPADGLFLQLNLHGPQQSRDVRRLMGDAEPLQLGRGHLPNVLWGVHAPDGLIHSGRRNTLWSDLRAQ